MNQIKNLLFLIIFILLLQGCFNSKSSKLTWVAINVSNPSPQGDAHVITKNGKTIIIDGGEYNQGKYYLLPYLKKNHILEIDSVMITHPHYDHYGGIIALLEDKSFKIHNLSMNMPTEKQMKKEWWGGKYENLVYINKLAKNRNIKVSPISKGDVFQFDKNSYLKVLYVFDGINTPIGETDINDMSAITMIYDGKNKFLLTGDLNKKLGTWLAKNAKDIKADILKVPHHSAESLAPNSFFDTVSAKQFIVPAPANFWNIDWDRTKRVKEYAQEHNITTYITGINGNITITSYDNQYNITIERKKSKVY
jgi:competence protein ComEC